jgi:hypothetical protein
MTLRNCRVFAAFLLTVLLLSACGCGQGEYDKRLKAAVTDVEYRSRYGVLETQPQVWLDQPFHMRLPLAFTRPRLITLSKLLCIKPMPGGILVNEPQLQISFTNLPGMLITNQAVVETPAFNGSAAAYSLHLAAANVGQGADETTLDKIRDDIKAACPDEKNVRWEDVELDTIDQKKLKMRRLRATGPGEIRFFGYVDAAGLYKGPMTLDLYTIKSGDYRVFIAWWVPAHLIENGLFKPDEIGKLTISTFTAL